MNTLFAAVRAVHYASAMLLMGELVFAFVLAGRGLPGGRAILGTEPLIGGDDLARRRLLWILGCCIVASLASSAAWLAITAAKMSGLPIGEALARDTLAQVLGSTLFGRVWMLRLGLLAALCALLLVLASAPRASFRPPLQAGMLALAAAYLGALAWAGHAAAAADGPVPDVAIASDGVHLLAGGAWLGALPALVFLLRRAPDPAALVRVTRRFSALGMLCVALLAASGIVNATNLVGSVPALFGTDYGRLLLAKIALFAAMLVLAAANRWNHAPRLAEGDHGAVGRLRRNAILEIAAGIVVVALVGLLGVTIPAAHQATNWPFAYTLSLAPLARSALLQAAGPAAGIVVCLAATAVVAGFIRRRPRLWLPGLVGVLVPTVVFALLLAVPAHPTTYAVSPIGYTTDAIVRGAALYASNCAGCHGPEGRGDGPAGRALSVRPTDLTAHAARHAEGDLFWWIAHGIPGTPMPGFAPVLEETDLWTLIQFLLAEGDAREAPALAQQGQAMPPIAAPDFTFELPGREQESLRQLRGSRVVLLVLYTLPQSVPRLTELALAASPTSASARGSSPCRCGERRSPTMRTPPRSPRERVRASLRSTRCSRGQRRARPITSSS
jgi:putative copper resistance protein D